MEKVNTLDIAKASQQPDILTKILKQNSDYFAEYFYENINQCISKSIFPSDLKLADVTPFYKKKSKNSKDNFRPVSILPNIFKIYERCIYDQIQLFFDSLLSKYQCGFTIPESKTSFQNYIHYNCPCLSTINLTDLELENAFASLKTNKSSGYNDISADVVKRVSDEIFVILKHIFNISLAKIVFPDKLKIARVTSIFKKGSNTLVTNYRPISVLPCFSKLLERIMYNRLYKFLVEKNILYQKQFGFQNAHLT